MKIILVNPPAQQILETHDQPAHPHIGLGYLAAILEKNNFDCQIIDAKLERLTLEQTIEKIIQAKPMILGLTSMTHDLNQAIKIAKEVKKKNRKITIIIGGIHATALPYQTLKDYSCFDFLVFGEGEYILLELLKRLKNSQSVRGLAGVAIREKNRVLMNPSAKIIENLDALPFPAWHFFPKARDYHIITARGCPFLCIFCASPYGRRVRERSPENVISELVQTIEKYQPKNYRFNDETFAFNQKRAIQILNLIIKYKLAYKTNFAASMRANKVDFALLKKMKKAGFVYIDYGVETGDAGILKRIKKGVTLKQTEKAIKETKKAKIRVGANFIIGHPGETIKTVKKTINYAIKLNADLSAFGIMVPYPGTEVAKIAQKGEWGYKIISNNWSDYNKQFGNALELENIGRKSLERLQALAYLKTYLFNFRIKNLISFIWQYRRAGLRLLLKQLKSEK